MSEISSTSQNEILAPLPSIARWRDYYDLTKPKVVFLMLITAWVGMLLAIPKSTHPFPWNLFLFGTIGIAASAASGAVINHLVERHLDAKMARTHHRPVASGRVSPLHAFLFALLLGCLGIGVLIIQVNRVVAALTLLSLIGYAFIYTLFLKRVTPQNIVIGGAAGAAPPLLGWAAITGTIDHYALLLVLIIFAWTPPHFWALAIYRRQEYARSGLPMLPVTHGVAFTKLCILLYTLILLAVSVFPFITGMSHVIYLVSALGLGFGFLFHVIQLYRHTNEKYALRTFGFSIIYLTALFIALLLDHYLS